MPLDWEFWLPGGREIFLTPIQQHRTYGDMLCGLPRDPERSVVHMIEAESLLSRDNSGATKKVVFLDLVERQGRR